MPAASPLRPGRTISRLAVALLLGAAVLPFLGALRNDFVGDDVAIVQKNPLLADYRRIPELFRENYWAPIDHSNLYRPLSMASYALNRALLGASPRGFHAVNLLLHALVSLLVYLLARQLADGAAGAGTGAALAAALVFAVHPLHGEAVLEVVGRSDLLASAGVLLCLLLHRRALAGHPRYFVGAALALGAGLLSKEVALGALVMLAAHDLALVRRGGRPRAWPWALYAAVTLAYLLARSSVLGANRIAGSPVMAHLDNPLLGLPLLDRLLACGRVLGAYAGLLLWPARLSADYSYAQVPVVDLVQAPLAWLGVALGLALVLVTLRSIARGRPGRAAAWGLCCGSYFVVSNVAVLVGALMAERFAYLPSAGLAIAAAGYLGRLSKSRAAALLLVPLLLACAWRSVRRTSDFRDESTLFARTAESSPNSIRARMYHAQVLKRDGEPAAALAEARRALAIDPGEAWTWNGLGQLHWPEEPAAARAAYERAIALYPGYTEARYHLGALLVVVGQHEQAIAELDRALALRPAYPEASLSLAEAWLSLGQPARARAPLEAALAARPDLPAAWLDLGWLREIEQQPDAAEQAYLRASTIDPKLDDAWLALGILRAARGQVEAALGALRSARSGARPPLEAYTRAAILLAQAGRLPESRGELEAARQRLGPSAQLCNNEGTLALLEGDREAAAQAWRRALELDPENLFARNHLAALGATSLP